MTGPLALDRPDIVRRLREVLVSSQFTAQKIGEALGTGDEIVSRTADIPVQLRHLESHAAFGALVRLFIAGGGVERSFAIVGGTGKYTGARGSYTANQDTYGLGGRGTAALKLRLLE